MIVVATITVNVLAWSVFYIKHLEGGSLTSSVSLVVFSLACVTIVSLFVDFVSTRKTISIRRELLSETINLLIQLNRTQDLPPIARAHLKIRLSRFDIPG